MKTVYDAKHVSKEEKDSSINLRATKFYPNCDKRRTLPPSKDKTTTKK